MSWAAHDFETYVSDYHFHRALFRKIFGNNRLGNGMKDRLKGKLKDSDEELVRLRAENESLKATPAPAKVEVPYNCLPNSMTEALFLSTSA